MATLQDLRDQLADLMQRDDQSDAQLDRFIDSALERTSQVLVSTYGEEGAVLAATANEGEFGLPVDYARVRGVFWSGAGAERELKPVSGLEAVRLVNAGGTRPVGYIIDDFLRTYPRVSSGIAIQYSRKPAALTTGASTNYLTDNYPRIILYGAAVEAALWERDMQSKQAFELEYAAAVDQANQEAERARYGAAPVAASHYQAPGGITRGM